MELDPQRPGSPRFALGQECKAARRLPEISNVVAAKPARVREHETIELSVSSRDRDTVYSYYRGEYAAGNCPPGLAKKDNGCLPPGQAKKMWAVGQPLPSSIRYEPLPPALLGRLSPAPAGYQYVRVDSDVLVMAAGTRMVTAAIADLSRF